MDKMNVFGASESENNVEMNMKSPAFGIDLGTTNSAIAVVHSGNTPRIIELEGGAKTLPSCLMWKGKKGQFIVGKDAYKDRYKPNVIYSVKRLMGSGKTVTLKYGGRELVMTPAEVSAEILKELVRQASVQYKEIKDVVITVPAYFNNEQVKDTLEAGKLAGLNVLEILREPTAASLVYDLESELTEQKTLIYDLGGGTYDNSLVRISKSEDLGELADIYGASNDESVYSTLFSVIDTDGDSLLGGDDIDKEMYKIVERKIADLGYDVSKIPNQEKEKITLRLERLKKKGPDNYRMSIDFKLSNGEKIKESIDISAADFVDATRVIYNRTKSKLKSVLNKTDVKSLTSIALVGGSTKSAIIQEFLKRDFPEVTINNALNPDESVALGAAVKAKEKKFGDKAVEVFDILPLAIGVLADGFVKPVIKRGQRVPYTTREIFATTVDNQDRIEVRVFQGNSSLTEECIELGMIPINNLPKKKAGEVAVYVTMSVDSNGVLKCHVESGGNTAEVELVNLFGSESKKEKLSNEDRRVVKWTKFAEKLEGSAKAEVLKVVNQYKEGSATVSDVSGVISKYTGEWSEVSKPSVPKETEYTIE